MNVQCQCGAVSFTTPTPAPTALYHCHCTECRKQSSSAYGTSAVFPAVALTPELRARLAVYTRPTDAGNTLDCYFCTRCGVRVLHRARGPDGTERPTVSIKGGLVDGLDWAAAKHIFARSAVVPIPDGAEVWQAGPGIN